MATVSALPFCLPALNGDTCDATNCTQAINTYLGRHIVNGAFCACKDRLPPSTMLQQLDVSAGVLIKTCAKHSTLIEYPVCMVGQPALEDCADSPDQYISGTGCRQWDWSSFEGAMLRGWSEEERWVGRKTKSNMVAMEECQVFSGLIANFNNLENELQIHSPFSSYISSKSKVGTKVFPHPSEGQLITSYNEVLIAMRSGVGLKSTKYSLLQVPC
jgi:hypothetical protein